MLFFLGGVNFHVFAGEDCGGGGIRSIRVIATVKVWGKKNKILQPKSPLPYIPNFEHYLCTRKGSGAWHPAMAYGLLTSKIATKEQAKLPA